MKLKSINPVNGALIEEYTTDSQEQVKTKIEKAHSTWPAWRKISYKERAQLLKRAGQLLRERKQELARLMALEMGKPLKEGIAEIEKCALVCETYAQQGASFLADERVDTEATKSYVHYEPLGVVLAVMPWNFPFWQVFRFAAPGLMAGNCCVLKHASNVTGCALAIEEIFTGAGFEDGVFQTLILPGKETGQVIEHPLVKAVTLTGSTDAGREVAALAGKNLKKTVLELGGSDPYLVLADADLEKAAKICAKARLINNGQSCIAAKRFIVVPEIAEEFTRLLRKEMAAFVTGDPLNDQSDLGPLARKDLRDDLHRQVEENIAAGARCILGGKIPDMPGEHAYYTPTLLTGITADMPAYREEIFGPVALILHAQDEQDAIRMANDSPFGLGAAVFTQDVTNGERIAREELRAGSCFVNAQVHSDPRLPFGGINDSGYGRELSQFGIREFVNIKTVYVK